MALWVSNCGPFWISRLQGKMPYRCAINPFPKVERILNVGDVGRPTLSNTLFIIIFVLKTT